MNLKSLIILSALILFPSVNAIALKSELPKTNDVSGSVNSKIKVEKEALEKLSAKKKDTEKKIKQLTLDIRMQERDVTKYKKEFSRLQGVVEELKKQIAEKEVTMPEIKKKISEYLRMIYMREKIYPIRILYTSKNYLKTVDVLNTIKIISLKEMDKFRLLKGKIDSLRDDKKNLQLSLDEAREMYNKSRQSQKVLLKKRKQMSYALSKIMKNSSQSEQKIAQLKKESEKITKKIEAPENKNETEFAVIINKNSEEKEEFGDFVYNKGNLMWPLKGGRLAEYNSDGNVENNEGQFENGISLLSRSSKAVQSVYNGKVIFSNPFLGFQNLVIIDHGSGYYSVYGYDGHTFVNKGQKVYTGKVLGKINLDRKGDSKLYFQVNLRGKSLNALEWLKSATM